MRKIVGALALLALGYLLALYFHWSLDVSWNHQTQENAHYPLMPTEGSVLVAPLRITQDSFSLSLHPQPPPISFDLFDEDKK